jgi:hypothetical protein
MQNMEYTRTRAARIPDALEAAARAGSPEFAGLGFSELLRALLAVAAGYTKTEALAVARGVRGQVLTVPESLMRAEARAEGCFAPYTAADGPAAHMPENCDGACHEHVTRLPRLPARPSPARVRRMRLDMAMYWAEDLMPPAPGAGYDFGFPRWMLRDLVLIAARDRAAARAAALRLLLGPARSADSPWARLRAALESRGIIGPRRDSGPPPRLARTVVLCCPRTGPPAGAVAVDALSIRAGGAVLICP